MKYTLTLTTLYLGVVFGLSPVCREGGRLRSDLQFKYAYKESLSASKDIDFSQRAGESIFCNSAGTSVTADGITKTIDCESVARSEGPGMDRFGWAKQLAVSKKGSVKIYSGDLNAAPTEFTSGTECGSTIKMALGSHYMAAVCQKAVRVYRFDGTTWHDHEEISFPNALDHELKLDLNHEDYLIVSEPSSTTVKIYKLGVIRSEVQSLTGDGAVAAAVNCRGSVFAYESSGAVKVKQLSQKDNTWSDLTDIAVDPVSLSMSSDVLAVGLLNSANVYMFANSGTEYAEYKVLTGGDSFGKLVSIEHDDLAVLDDTRAYLFHDGASTKCRALQHLVDGACVDCGVGHTNAHDNTETTCNVIQCTSSEYSLNGECKACPVGATGVAGPANVDSVCTCAAGKSFDAVAGTCDAILCAEDEHVVSNVCEACPAGTTNVAGDDSSSDNTDCDAVLCAENEHVVGNVCTPCVEGSSNTVGDDASGDDTACTPDHTCAVNQFYDTANHCQACPAGTEKAVAVDSTGGNSTCDDVVCVENHYVKLSYVSDSTKKYGSTSCTGTSDCETKCTADSTCAGYTDNGFSTVKAWGNSANGGTDPGVIDNLVDVVSNNYAFAALKNDGSVQVWGSSTNGGTDPGLTSGVVKIYSTDYAFAALKSDGSITAWGHSTNGGGTDAPTGTGYTQIYSTDYAFAALKSDGSITAWGHSTFGGDGAPTDTGYTQIFANKYAFAAMKADGSITVWGDSTYGGGTDAPTGTGYTQIFSTEKAFAVLKSDGSISVWGDSTRGGGTDAPTDTGYTQIFANKYAFAALKSDGSITSWGSSFDGSTPVAPTGTGYTQIYSTSSAFAAMKADGSITVWGSSDHGGTDAPAGTGYMKIYSTSGAFAALKSDGSITVWGLSGHGGGTDAPTGTGYTQIFSTTTAFAALKSDGSVTAWGSSTAGGTDPSISSGVANIYSTHAAFVAVGPSSLAYGPEVVGTGASVTKDKGCTACHADATRPAGDPVNGPATQCSCNANFEGDGLSCSACGDNQESAGGDDKCKCSAGSEGDGTACQICPENSNALVGPISDTCVKNEDAIWFDEIVNNLADAGACQESLDCTSNAATEGSCVQAHEDGGVLQATTPCCKIEKPSKCLCEENFRVSSNACVACPTGETRPAGDDPDNGNTYCNTEGITLSFTHNGNEDFIYNGQNDPDISLKVGQKYTFLRDSAGHPLRIVSEADCPSCSTGTYSTLPTSSVSNVDAEQGLSNVVVTFKKAGTYYYVCTAHASMVGKLVVAWDACSINAQGSTSLSSSCEIQSSLSLTGAISISAVSARLRSTGDKILLSMSDTVSPAINAGDYAVSLSGVEITDITSDNQLVTSTSGTISLNGVDIKDNPRNLGTGALFRSSGHIVAQSLNVANSQGELLQAESGGDISLADSIIRESGDIIKQVGGAVVVRGVSITGGGKLADLEDATSVFEAVVTDGGEGIKAVKSAVQIERSDFKGHAAAPVHFDSRSCTKCKRELVISDTKFQDTAAINVDSDVGNKPVVKVIEGNFTLAGSVVSSNGMDLYVIDEIDGKSMTTSETKTETCLPNQCSHKPLATSCKVSPGKGTQCVCDVGVATYKVQEKELEKQTTVEEILSMLFATAETADRIVKLVDKNVRYIPTQETAEAAKSNILLLKPSNVDGEFQSEKTILLKPDTGSVCATFQTWLCAELTACHYANGTITADCDGNKILTGTSNAARRFRLRSSQHPDDPNCQGTITNLKQQCVDGDGGFYTRCVKNAFLKFDQCTCIEGLNANSAGTECVEAARLCGVNEHVQSNVCVPCADGLMNKAGDDSSGANTQCDDVVCEENFRSDGSGSCTACSVGQFNLAGDVAKEGTTDQAATICCGSGEYEFSFNRDTNARVCHTCDDTTNSIRNRFGANGGGLHCCRGTRLASSVQTQCDRIIEYYKRICQPLESAATCPAQSYK